MTKTNYPSITPLNPTVGQSEITFRFNVISFADVTDLSYSIYNEEVPAVIVSSGTLEHTGEFWPYGEDFSVTASELEYNSGTYVCVLSATNANGTTESAQKCTLKSYTDWATPDEVLAGNRYIGEDSEAHVGDIVTKTATNITFSNGNVNVPVGYYAEQVTKEYPEPVLETVPVTPTTSSQTITPSTGYDGIGTVNVSAVTSAIDANIEAGNIKNGVTILGVTGTMTGGPTDGGAEIQACEYVEHIGGDPDAPSGIVVNFTTLPSPIDQDHTYFVELYIQTHSDDYGAYMYFPYLYPNITWNTLDIIQYGIEVTNEYGLPKDDQEAQLATSPAKLFVYDNDPSNLLWIIPCTFTNTTLF